MNKLLIASLVMFVIVGATLAGVFLSQSGNQSATAPSISASSTWRLQDKNGTIINLYFDLNNQRVRFEEESPRSGRLQISIQTAVKTYSFTTALPSIFSQAAAKGVNITDATKKAALTPTECKAVSDSAVSDVTPSAVSSGASFVGRVNNVNQWKIAGVDFTEDATSRQPLTFADMTVLSYFPSVDTSLFSLPAACVSAQGAKDAQAFAEKAALSHFTGQQIDLQSDDITQFRLPGTHWCGKGNDCCQGGTGGPCNVYDGNCCAGGNTKNTGCGNTLGGTGKGCNALNQIDLCCRQHDMCPKAWEGSTQSCACDKRIYDCAGSGDVDNDPATTGFQIWAVRTLFHPYNFVWPCKNWEVTSTSCNSRYWWGGCRSYNYAWDWVSQYWDKYSSITVNQDVYDIQIHNPSPFWSPNGVGPWNPAVESDESLAWNGKSWCYQG